MLNDKRAGNACSAVDDSAEGSASKPSKFDETDRRAARTASARLQTVVLGSLRRYIGGPARILRRMTSDRGRCQPRSQAHRKAMTIWGLQAALYLGFLWPIFSRFSTRRNPRCLCARRPAWRATARDASRQCHVTRNHLHPELLPRLFRNGACERTGGGRLSLANGRFPVCDFRTFVCGGTLAATDDQDKHAMLRP